MLTRWKCHNYVLVSLKMYGSTNSNISGNALKIITFAYGSSKVLTKAQNMLKDKTW